MQSEAMIPAEIFSLVDLTDLAENTDENALKALCLKAVRADAHVAAVCVWPCFVARARELLLAVKNIKIATVANFPSGEEVPEAVFVTIRKALQDGADEIDVVFPYKKYLAGETQAAERFIRDCRGLCGNKILKVILESGAFTDMAQLRAASESVCRMGADFLKTSTGKIGVGATLEVAGVLLTAIRSLSSNTGLKVSGGIRTVESAQEYIALAKKIMGNTWVSPDRFRIGASRL